jgi:hypothetical protein
MAPAVSGYPSISRKGLDWTQAARLKHNDHESRTRASGLPPRGLVRICEQH